MAKMKKVVSAFKTVFSKPFYTVLAAVITAIVFSFSVWLPNFKLIVTVWKSGLPSLIEKIVFPFTLYAAIGTNFSIVSATYTILIAIFFGINIAMLVYYIKVRRVSLANSGTASGIGGLVSGIFGVGCASCGTFILTSVLALFGAGGLVTILPFGGEEFGILGLALILFSVYIMAKKIEEPLTCSST